MSLCGNNEEAGENFYFHHRQSWKLRVGGLFQRRREGPNQLDAGTAYHQQNTVTLCCFVVSKQAKIWSTTGQNSNVYKVLQVVVDFTLNKSFSNKLAAVFVTHDCYMFLTVKDKTNQWPSWCKAKHLPLLPPCDPVYTILRHRWGSVYPAQQV